VKYIVNSILRLSFISNFNNWCSWHCSSDSSFFISYQKYFNSPLNKERAEKKKSLIKEQKELNERLEKIEQDLKNL